MRIKVLTGEIPVVDVFDIRRYFDVPTSPVVVRASEIWLRPTAESLANEIVRGNFFVLYGHGFVRDGQWVFASGKSIPSALSELNQRGISPDLLFVCNPGKVAIQAYCTYFLGDVAGAISIENSEIVVRVGPKEKEGRTVRKPQIRILS